MVAGELGVVAFAHRSARGKENFLLRLRARLRVPVVNGASASMSARLSPRSIGDIVTFAAKPMMKLV